MIVAQLFRIGPEITVLHPNALDGTSKEFVGTGLIEPELDQRTLLVWRHEPDHATPNPAREFDIRSMNVNFDRMPWGGIEPESDALVTDIEDDPRTGPKLSLIPPTKGAFPGRTVSGIAALLGMASSCEHENFLPTGFWIPGRILGQERTIEGPEIVVGNACRDGDEIGPGRINDRRARITLAQAT